jgi:fructokinase
MKVLSFGEILFDVIEDEYYLGGAPLNFAAHLAQCGVESYIFSKVGADELGAEALRQVRGLGVKTDFVEVDEAHATGTVEVLLNAGQPDYTIFENVAYDFITLDEKVEAFGKTEFDLLYYGTLAQRSTQSREALRQIIAQRKFKQVFYDVNLRKGFYNQEILENSLQHCTMLKLNDEEVKVLSQLLYQQELSMEEFSRKAVAAYGIAIVIITAGAAGCYLYEGGQLLFVPGQAVVVADTVGAGDAFSAAFVYKYLSGASAVEAARAATRLGAYVASCRGPIPAYTSEIIKILGLKINITHQE